MGVSTSFWGGLQSSGNYQFLMEGKTIIDSPFDLTGHGITSIDQELTDAVDYNQVMLDGGRIVNRSIRVRPPERTALTMTVLMGGHLWSRLRARADRSPYCRTNLFARRICADDDKIKHTYIFKNTTFEPPTMVNDFIPIDGSANVVEWQSNARAEALLTQWAIGGSVLSDQTPALYAITFVPDDCVECDKGDLYQKFFAVGGAGGASDPLIVYRTTNRFNTVTALTTPAPNGNVGTSVWAFGDVVLVGFADNPAVASGTTGGTLFSTNSGSSFTIDANINEPVRGVGVFANRYFAVGGTGAGAALMWYSDNGVNWTQITSSALSSTDALTSMAVDEEEQTLWAVGEAGTLYKVKSAGTNFSVANVSSLLPGSPGTLNVVRVYGPGHIAVAGASGYYAESTDNGETWKQIALPTTVAIFALDGTPYRSLVGGTTTFYLRDIDSDMTYKVKTLEDGAAITGNLRGIARPRDVEQNGLNYFAFVTTQGEIGLFKPFYPDA